jgi:hypothetical protein
MQMQQSLIGRALTSGTVSALTASLAAALTGKRETGSYTSPLNATSHILWGDEAARHDEPSWKYTATGFLLNHAAAVMWGAAFARWFDKPEEEGIVKPLIGAAVVTAGAYVTDYYLVPKRFTPGFEKRVSGRSLATIYGALALGLAASSLISRR